jgi:DNA-binding NarL/FixJ family response regulator
VLIVDDQPQIRIGLQMRLNAEPDMTVVGCAVDGIDALEQVGRLHPDIILMDVDMPRLDGVTASSQLAQQQPSVPVLILTIYDDQCTRRRAAEARVAGFITKAEPIERLLALMRAIGGRQPDEALTSC